MCLKRRQLEHTILDCSLHVNYAIIMKIILLIILDKVYYSRINYVRYATCICIPLNFVLDLLGNFLAHE